MRERHLIAIEAGGLALIVGSLIYALGFLSAMLLLLGVGLVATAQIVKMR